VKKKMEVAQARTDLEARTAAALSSIQSDLDPNLIALSSRVSVLNWRIESLRQSLATVKAEVVQASSLLEQVETLRAAIAGLQQRFEAAKIDASVENTGWATLTEPWVDESKPINKDWTINGLLALVLGAFIGLGIALIRFREKPA